MADEQIRHGHGEQDGPHPKVKDDGRVKNRVIVDMLRSGGNARAKVPERLVLPRVIDVLEAARRTVGQQ